MLVSSILPSLFDKRCLINAVCVRLVEGDLEISAEVVVIDKLVHRGRCPLSDTDSAVTFAEGIADICLRVEVAFPTLGPVCLVRAARIELDCIVVKQFGDGLFLDQYGELRLETCDVLCNGHGNDFGILDNGDHGVRLRSW